MNIVQNPKLFHLEPVSQLCSPQQVLLKGQLSSAPTWLPQVMGCVSRVRIPDNTLSNDVLANLDSASLNATAPGYSTSHKASIVKYLAPDSSGNSVETQYILCERNFSGA